MKNNIAQATPGKETGKAVFRIPDWALPLLLIIVASLYARAIFNNFTAFDDEGYIVANPYLRDFSWAGVKAIFTSFYAGNYHPFTTSIYLVIYRFFGLNPMPYHIVNVLLHLLNTWLCFKVALKLSGRQITAFIVAAFFALHPLHVESVAWLSELKDVLYAAFYLAALYTYMQYIDSGKRKYYFITLLLFLCSLFSKSAAVTLPVLLIVVDIYKGRKTNGRLFVEKIPFFLLAILFGILAIFSQRSGEAISNLLYDYGYLNRTFLFTSTLSFYLIKLIAPFHLNAMHFYPILTSESLPWINYASLPFIALLVIIIINVVRKRPIIGKEIIFGLLFFLVTISVMLQVMSVGSAFAAERYTYIPYIGLFYIVGQWVSGNFENKKFRQAAIAILSVLIVVFSIQTWDRISVWKDTDTLFSNIIEGSKDNDNPGVFLIYNTRAVYKKNMGDLDGAREDFKETLQILNTILDTATDKNIDREDARDYLIRAHIYDELGNYQSAIPDYNKYLTVITNEPTIYNDRGRAYFQSGNKQMALQDFDKAIALNGRYAEAYNNRGWLYAGIGDTKAAMINYDHAVEYMPSFDKPYFNRAMLKAYIHDFKGCISDFDIFQRMHPDDTAVAYYLGVAYFNLQDTSTACKNWQKAITLGSTTARVVAQSICK